jgi:cytochrome P450
MAGGCLALAEHPEQWEKLKQHPEMLRTAVDEMIRWVTPIKHFMRTATRDGELGGEPIRAGESITMYYLSGNRDGEVFDAPFEFRVDRSPNRHLAFGFGAHVCLGMALSRLELTTMFGELLRRIESLEPAGPVRPVETNFLGGYKSAPIRFKLSAAT